MNLILLQITQETGLFLIVSLYNCDLRSLNLNSNTSLFVNFDSYYERFYYIFLCS